MGFLVADGVERGFDRCGECSQERHQVVAVLEVGKCLDLELPGFGDVLSGSWNAIKTIAILIAIALVAVAPFAAVALLLSPVFIWIWRRLPRPTPKPQRIAPMPPPPPGPADANEEGAETTVSA